MALITFAGHVNLHFNFNDLKFNTNNTMVIRYLNELSPAKGTTSTDQALKLIYDLFTDPTKNSGKNFNF